MLPTSKKADRPHHCFLSIKNQPPTTKDIFQVQIIFHSKSSVEESYERKEIVKCKTCQSYGHTYRYCYHLPKCVKCVGLHLTGECQNIPDRDPNRSLCAGKHLANYRQRTVKKNVKKNWKRLTKQLRTSYTQQAAQRQTQPVQLEKPFTQDRQ